jgi:hypothetical protein
MILPFYSVVKLSKMQDIEHIPVRIGLSCNVLLPYPQLCLLKCSRVLGLVSFALHVIR